MTIKINGLTINRGGKTILKDFSLVLKSDFVTGLIGPSGCGKTSLLYSLLGIVHPNVGEIFNANTLYSNPNFCLEVEKREFGIVFQDLALFPHLTLSQNIGFGLHQFKKIEKERRIDELLNLFKLAKVKDSFPDTLSGGEKQRLALARALAPKPNYLLMDETFSDLDPILRVSLRSEIRNIFKEMNLGALFVSHDMDEVMGFSDQIVILNERGEIQQQDTPKIIMDSPKNNFVQEFIGK